MKLTGAQFQELTEALLDAFDRATLTFMLRARLDKDLDHLVGPGSLQTVIFEVVRTAEREGWVYALAREAHDWVPDNDRLAVIAASLTPPGADDDESPPDQEQLPIPPIDINDPPIAAIRQLLIAAFTPEDLRRFCHLRPDFRRVVNNFGPGQGLEDMVDRVIVLVQTRLLWQELLAEVVKENPAQYKEFLQELGINS